MEKVLASNIAIKRHFRPFVAMIAGFALVWLWMPQGGVRWLKKQK
jgi:hypothetical protein